MNIYDCRHVYREVNRTASSLVKKGIGIMNFHKDVTIIIFKDYCGSLSNRICRINYS